MVFLSAGFSLSGQYLRLHIYEKDLAERPNPNILGQGQTSNNHVSSYYGIEIYFLDHSFHKLSLESFVLFFDMNMLSSDLK